ncbi:MAG: hypothetical protein E7018_05345 [Alphaproteobacteria bacterium]|nr:hypothetical protein [Alphaproteobacteria bacterium]
MLKKLVYILLLLIVPLSSFANIQEGGKVILQLEDNAEPQAIDYLKLYNEYISELDYFDHKFPGNRIQEDFKDEIQQLHPEYTDKQTAIKENALWFGIRLRRAYRKAEQTVKDFLFDNGLSSTPAPLYSDNEPIPYNPDMAAKVIVDIKQPQTNSDSPAAPSSFGAQQQALLKKYLLSGNWKSFFQEILSSFILLDDERGIGKWVHNNGFQARLVSDKTAFNTDTINGSLQFFIPQKYFLLSRDYKEYKASTVQFSASENLKDISLNWPMPQRMYVNLKHSITGYTHIVNIPFEAKLVDSAKTAKLVANISGNICKEDTCISIHTAAQLELQPDSNPQDSAAQTMLEIMALNSPKPQSEDFELKSLLVEQDASGNQVLRLDVITSGTPSSFEAYIEGDGADEFLPPLTRIDGRKIAVRFVPYNSSAQLEGRKFSILASTSPHQTIRQQMTAKSKSITDTDSTQVNLGIALLAILGGFLLNFMPCVFPVLALKIMSFTKFGALKIDQIRRTFIYNLCGILLGFVLLIILLICFKLLGYAVGWGMQFQSIGFLVIMIFVITTFIAHLYGIINIPIPQIFAQYTNINHSQALSQILNGLFVVLLSTPCTAPYLGTALGIALAGSPLHIALLVGCVGLGLSIPYIIFAIFPYMAYYMPRPGRWMTYINHLMFAMLIMTLLWLLSLISAQSAGSSVWAYIIYLGCFWFVLILRRYALESLESQKIDAYIYKQVRRLINIIVAIIISIIIAISYFNTSDSVANKISQNQFTRLDTLNMQRINNILRTNRGALVKIGADWCLTCKYNNFVAFDSPAVQELLKSRHIEVIEVDWTTYREDVLQFMRKFGRSGLPFYVLFTPLLPDGMVLPEFINELELKEILSALTPYRK